MLWWLADDPELRAAARNAISDRSNDVHRDPFDRLLVAQATIEHLALVTRDGILAKYGVPIMSA